jgi:hypothetical protein
MVMDLNKQFDYVVMTNINILYAKNSFEFSLFIVIIFEIYILIGNKRIRRVKIWVVVAL